MDSEVKIRVKRLGGRKDIPLPSYETAGSSGMDLRAAVEEDLILNPGEIKLIPTGLSISLPRGFEAQVRPRSGLALSHGLGIVNSPGTIDCDYRGEIKLVLINWGPKPFAIRRGDRVAQMVIARVYRADVIDVMDLDSTARGEGGFGHSGTD